MTDPAGRGNRVRKDRPEHNTLWVLEWDAKGIEDLRDKGASGKNAVVDVQGDASGENSRSAADDRPDELPGKPGLSPA